MEDFKKWFENYWYHYKWMTIVIVFFLITGSVCLVQCSSKGDYDIYTLYAGPTYIGADQSTKLKDAINDYMEADKQNVCINSFVYVSEAKKDEYKQGDAYVNDGINMQQTTDFFDFLYSASFNMIILDAELYSMIKKDEILTPMSDISDIASQRSVDGYSIKLSDTSLPDKYSVFKEMPDDTVLCFRKNVLMQSLSQKNNKAKYDYQKEIFRKIIEQ